MLGQLFKKLNFKSAVLCSFLTFKKFRPTQLVYLLQEDFDDGLMPQHKFDSAIFPVYMALGLTMLDQDSVDLDNIAKAFGLVVIQWGNCEQSLDMLTALLWQSFPTRELARRIPVMLTPKLEFVRKSFAGVESLKHLQPQAELVFAEFDRLSKIRNDLIHGAVASLAPVDDHFVLLKFDVHDDFHYVREVRLPITEYPKLARDLVNLGKTSHQLSRSVFELAEKLEAEVRK